MLEWAARSRVPVFAEPMVTGVPEDVRIPFQQTLLGDEEVTGLFEQIIVTGRPTLSRPVQAVCASGKRVVVVASYGQWPDLHGNASCVVPALHDNDCVDEARQLLLLETLRERVKEVRTGIEEMIAVLWGYSERAWSDGYGVAAVSKGFPRGFQSGSYR